jgi:hypothetical protein
MLQKAPHKNTGKKMPMKSNVSTQRRAAGDRLIRSRLTGWEESQIMGLIKESASTWTWRITVLMNHP